MSNATKNKESSWKRNLGYIALIEFIVIVVLIFALWRNVRPETMDLEITDPSGKGVVKLGIKAQRVDTETMLKTLFQVPSSLVTLGVVEWLRANQSMYALTDERLVDALKTNLCSPIPDQPLDLHIQKAQECADKKVASALRQLAQDHAPPFQYVGKPGYMGVPSNEIERPAPGKANVCRDGGLLGKTLKVIAGDKSVQVEAVGPYDCTGYDAYPDIQLSVKDATLLFDRPIGFTEHVLIVPLR